MTFVCAAALCAVVYFLWAGKAAACEDNTGSWGWKFNENNNNLVSLQKEGGDPEKPGTVRVEYFAHSAFRITSPKGLSAVIDPWRNDPSGAWGLWFPEQFPEIDAGIVLSTHAHFDHDAVHRVHAPVTLERPVGVFTLGDMRITGLGDKHMFRAKGSYLWTDAFADFGVPLPPDNPMNLDNSIIMVETGGRKIVHWGDNRPDIPDHIAEAVREADVMFMPIDGSEHILTLKDMEKLTAALRPRAVVPCHYRARKVVTVLSTLQPSDAYVNTVPDSVRLDGPRWDLQPGDLSGWLARPVYFGDHYCEK